MKKRTFLAITASFVFTVTIISCGSDSAKGSESHTTESVKEVAGAVEEAAVSIDGAELFTSSGCVACHQTEVKTVGPAITGIKEAYSGNADGLTAFLKGEADAIVDVAMAAVMAPQIETTKAMTIDERAAIIEYLLN
tara:strand:+ start:10433 stop:10843 length:411 start_codon:yes stop_codon:yes gene_type:complete